MAAPSVPRIKICGITTPGDAEHAVALGVWAVGLNFWPGSARRCDPGTAAEIAAAVKRRAEAVGVFVNPTLEHVAAIAEAVGLSMIQLHGDEGPAFCAEVARRTGAKVIKAARVHSGADIQALAAFHVDYHLLDSYVPGQRGGTGESFAWELARRHRGSVPVILSGGLDPENVAEAIAAVRPFAVDVASGVESGPGRKDAGKVEAFVTAVVESAGAAVAESAGAAVAESAGAAVAESAGAAVAESSGAAVVESSGAAVVESSGAAVVESAGAAVVESAGADSIGSSAGAGLPASGRAA